MLVNNWNSMMLPLVDLRRRASSRAWLTSLFWRRTSTSVVRQAAHRAGAQAPAVHVDRARVAAAS
jgi:hypothetical protein